MASWTNVINESKLSDHEQPYNKHSFTEGGRSLKGLIRRCLPATSDGQLPVQHLLPRQANSNDNPGQGNNTSKYIEDEVLRPIESTTIQELGAPYDAPNIRQLREKKSRRMEEPVTKYARPMEEDG